MTSDRRGAEPSRNTRAGRKAVSTGDVNRMSEQ
jgi:hypothetical protein